MTAIRAVAAWWVVFYHFNDQIPLPEPFGGLVKNGNLAVDLFFILSGYVLTRQYADRFTSPVSRGTFGWFITTRLARIYPLHLVVLGLFLSLPLALALTGRQPSSNFRPADFLRSIVLVQDWFIGGALNWNGPAWSISAEFLFYLIFPLAVNGLGKTVRTTTGLLVVPVVIFAAIIVKGLFYGGLIGFMGQFGVFRCLTGCLLGMWLWHASRRWPMGQGASLGLLAFAAALFAMPALAGVEVWIIATPAFLCLVWALLNPYHWVSRALSHPVLLWLGRVSFSTYMIHYFIRDWLRLILAGHATLWFVFTVYTVLVAVASAVLHHWVEVPGRAAGRRLAGRLFALPVSGPMVQSVKERSA